jgi:regulatory protein
MPRAKQTLSLKGRALAALAQREHSATELRRKLLRHAQAEAANADSRAGQAAAEGTGNDGDREIDQRAAAEAAAVRVDAVIDWLRAHNYLSEERFVERRVNARAPRYGNLRIRHELAQHGLALSPDAAQALRDSELERATDAWRRKFGGTTAADAAERARQSRFLAQRGFSPEVIFKLMREVRRADAAVAHDEPDDC